MMQDLRNALNGGGQQMENLETAATVEETVVTEVVDDNVGDPSVSDYVKKEEEEKKEDSKDKNQEDPEDSKDDKDDKKEDSSDSDED